MTFFNDSINILQVVIVLIGGGLAVFGLINLLEAYGSDNAAGKSQGTKQLMAGVGIAILGFMLIPKLKDLVPEGAKGGSYDINGGTGTGAIIRTIDFIDM